MRRVQVCYFELNLTFAGGSPFPQEAFRFTQTPEKTLYVTKGSDAALEWDYSAVNKEADLRRIKWTVFNKWMTIVRLQWNTRMALLNVTLTYHQNMTAE